MTRARSIFALLLSFAGCRAIAGVGNDYRTAPPAWEGPVSLLLGEGGVAPECPPGFDERSRLHLGVRSDDVECSCEVPVEACRVDLQYSSAQCLGIGKTVTLEPATCTPVELNQGMAVTPTLTETGLACESSGPLPAPHFDEVARACATCRDAGCAQPPPDARECYLRVGDYPCPEDDPHEDRILYYENVVDERHCDCGVATCGGSIGIHTPFNGATAKQNCESLLLAAPALALDDCKPLPLDVDYVQFTASARACSGGEVSSIMGELRETTPVTLCCLPLE